MSDNFTRIAISDSATWLSEREKHIQASDASVIHGCNRWKTATALWDEKKGLVFPRDISDKPYVQYGKKMEPLIREQFLLDNPYFSCDYHEFDILVSKDRTWQGCTLDGELTVTTANPWNLPIGTKGVLECKTGTFKKYDEYKDWCSFPVYYFCQIVHQLSVTGWSFAMTASRIKREAFKESDNGFPEIHTLYHLFRRADLYEDIAVIEIEEASFQESLDNNRRPALTLSL